MYVASSKVSSSEVEKHLCRVCSKPFLTISSRNKHERVNRKCSEVSIVEVGGADYGHDEGEGVGVEFTLNNIGKQCNFCQHKFTTVFCAKQHLCLLSPSFGPEYTVLQLVEEDVAGELQAPVQLFIPELANMPYHQSSSARSVPPHIHWTKGSRQVCIMSVGKAERARKCWQPGLCYTA